MVRTCRVRRVCAMGGPGGLELAREEVQVLRGASRLNAYVSARCRGLYFGLGRMPEPALDARTA